jgi:hypothetical protein
MMNMMRVADAGKAGESIANSPDPMVWHGIRSFLLHWSPVQRALIPVWV